MACRQKRIPSRRTHAGISRKLTPSTRRFTGQAYRARGPCARWRVLAALPAVTDVDERRSIARRRQRPPARCQGVSFRKGMSVELCLPSRPS
jgi:hypothetical protein